MVTIFPMNKRTVVCGRIKNSHENFNRGRGRLSFQFFGNRGQLAPVAWAEFRWVQPGEKSSGKMVQNREHRLDVKPPRGGRSHAGDLGQSCVRVVDRSG